MHARMQGERGESLRPVPNACMDAPIADGWRAWADVHMATCAESDVRRGAVLTVVPGSAFLTSSDFSLSVLCAERRSPHGLAMCVLVIHGMWLYPAPYVGYYTLPEHARSNAPMHAAVCDSPLT